MDCRIEPDRFARRVRNLVSAWTWPLDALVLVLGRSSDDDGEAESKEVAMHFWLLGVMFHETVVVLLRSGHVIFLASQKKVDMLRQITTGVTLIVRKGGPGEAVDEDQVAELARSIRGDEPKATVGMLTKSQHLGAFAEAFVKSIMRQNTLEITDCREEISTLLAPKDEEELDNVQKCSRVLAHAMQGVLMSQWEAAIDGGQPLTNKELCSAVDEKLEGEDLMRSLETAFRLEPNELVPVYVSHQSGESFAIRIDAVPDEKPIPMSGAHGTYLLFMAFRYREYAACLARTMFLHPTNLQQEAYTLARSIHTQVMGRLRPGAMLRDIYLEAKAEVQRNMPHLLPHFCKNVGFGMGLELRDSQLVISEKSEKRVMKDTVFCVSIGFAGAVDQGAPWAVWLADTVAVREGGGQVWTAGCKTDPTNVQFFLDCDQPDAAQPPPPATQPQAPKAPMTAAVPVPAATAVAAAPKERKAKAKAKGKSKEAAAKASTPSRGGAQARAKPRGKADVPPKRNTRANAAAAVPAVTRSRGPQVIAKNVPPRKFRDRTEKTKAEMSRLAHLEDKQCEIRRKKFEEIRARFAAEKGRKTAAAETRRLSDFVAYRSCAETPVSEPKPLRLQVDVDAQALLAPINGSLVPFHVSCIKNMTRSTVERFQILQVNFFTPGNGKSNEDFPAATPNRAFVKELTFRSEQRENMDLVVRNFTEARKRLRQKELEGETSKASRRHQAAVEEPSEPLQTLRPFPCLRDLNVRPTIASGSRRTVGTLEAHANGFRFSIKGSADKVDILYTQVKHAIFEPCERNALIVLVHLHLRAPIMVGKRKTLDIQFFAEVGPQVDDLSQRRSGSAYDPDEIMEEQNERLMREKVNKWFQEWCKQVEDIKSCPLKFDVPFRDAAFTGVPFKTQVHLAFGSDVLCGLQEWPPLVVSLDEVDVVVFERATMMLREFDMVCVMKDYEELPLRITTIPKTSFDMIRSHLAEREMAWYSSPMNIHWAAVMKQVNTDPDSFVESGGWDPWFIGGGSESEGSAGGGSSDFSGGSDDELSDDHVAEEDEGSDISIGDDEDDDDGGDDLEDDDEDGLDWDELERRAEKADRKRERSRSRDRGAAAAAGRSKRPRR